MRTGGKRRLRFVLPLAFVLPLLAVSALGYAALRGGAAETGPPLAPGVQGGAFHPVAGNFRPDDTVLAGCGASYACLQQAFGNVAYRRGVRPALALFDEQTEQNPLVRKDCHRITHLIGSAAFARFDGDVARTFAVGSATCASGYYHGVLERAFVGVTTRAELVDRAGQLCVADGIRRRSFLDYQCRHGLGHGLMIQTGYDLPLALATCDRLETRWDAVACTGGAFMENGTTRFGYRSKWLDDEDPLYPCGIVAARHRRSCYLRVAVRILGLGGMDFEAAGRTCGALQPEYAQACFRGLGREVAGTARYDAPRIVDLCARAGRGSPECLYGAARTVADGSGLSGARRAAELCGSVPSSARDECLGGLGVVVGLLYPTHDARRRACARLASRYADACSQAAVAEVDPSGRGAWG